VRTVLDESQPHTAYVTESPDVLYQRALGLYTAGQLNDALVQLFDGLGRAAPAEAASERYAAVRALLASMLEPLLLHGADETLVRVLLLLADDPAVPVQSLALPLGGLLVGAPAAAVILQHAPSPNLPEAMRVLTAHPLVQRVLPRIVVTHAPAERLLLRMREVLLDMTVGDAPEAWCWDAVQLIGCAAYNGEYAWRESPREARQLAADAALVDTALGVAVGDAPSIDIAACAPALLRLAMYRRLSATLTHWASLATIPPSSFGPHAQRLSVVLDAHVHERLDEQRRSLAIEQLALTSDEGSERVRAQYESHPYPRWVHPPSARVTSIAAFCRELQAQVPPPTSQRVLIAGCGTGRQVVHMAASFPDADITAVDLSLASLGYAARMVDTLQVPRVRFLHGDLLALDALPDTFAIVSCSGVLHHLVDPRAGWRQLVQRLEERGVMKIGLYSTAARASVRAARAVIAPHGLPDTDDALRSAREQLLALDAAHPAHPITQSVDFHSLSGFRDLVVHVQERTYTIPEIAAELRALDLSFLGFQLTRGVQTQFAAAFPKANASRDLEAWDRFEARHPQTFSGMYQFWCAHASSTRAPSRPRAPGVRDRP
jgi:SAM-dependent methyltransferase